MSVEELKFKDENDNDDAIIVKFQNNVLRIDNLEFDRSEAYISMLYLQKHLSE